MKIFVSWSGQLSQKVAEQLKKWIPCIIQSVDVFFSPDDIEKGENWDSKISKELSECRYGIVCLTRQNVTSPWINFEAGALAKSLDSRVTCLMLDIQPSDIKGPLSRYQATKMDKDDFYHLIQTINNATDCPLDDGRLQNAFDAMWDQMETGIREEIERYGGGRAVSPQKENPLEEILQLLRKVNTTVSSPEELLPPSYFASLQKTILSGSREANMRQFELCFAVLKWMDTVLSQIAGQENELYAKMLCSLHFDRLIYLLEGPVLSMRPNGSLYRSYQRVRNQYERFTRRDDVRSFFSENSFPADLPFPEDSCADPGRPESPGRKSRIFRVSEDAINISPE